jgi:hypothetical protein
MGGYFLKTHYKSIGTYPEKAIHFPEGNFRMAEEFSQADFFLLYETRKGDRPGLEGAGALWALGHPLGKVIRIPTQKVNGRRFSLAVPIELTTALLDRTQGVAAARVQEIIERPLGFVGGVWELTGEQFILLCRELEGCLEHEERYKSKRTNYRTAASLAAAAQQ